MHNRMQSKEGFTLVELIVAIGMFSVVVVSAIALMISTFNAQAKAIAVKDVIDNGRFTLELMTRELRTATGVVYTATPPANCPRRGLEYTSYNQAVPEERFYYWEDTDGDGSPDAIMRVAMPSAGSVDCITAPPQQFTSPGIVVDNWILNITGNDPSPDDGQPRITIGFVIHSRDVRYGHDTMLNIQTTVIPRGRD
ncbi:MAG: type II secretion system protein [bacterium]|nr:type II secretion system protein [bacterium]MDZ4285351.1 type II secretion system protein [Candidatus Sungbacteria bacterium]